MIYCIFKIFRYFRLFEIDGQIEESLEHQANSKTVFEIKKIERNMQILQFSLKTIINLHILTCSIVVLWTHYGEEMENDEFYSVYIKAIYFVTTTLTTCGFGDISAKQNDAREGLVILALQFVGMLFYSVTI